MKYKIFRIEEQLYGCEEPPADQPILVDVVLEGADGTRRVLPYPAVSYTHLRAHETD